MASLCTKGFRQISRRNFSITISCGFRRMPDPMELATGLEKRELLARAAGIEHPFDQKLFKRGPGTKDSPNLIPSAFEARMVGCICEPEATHINWMWLHKGYPKRCSCGHWFQLEEKAPLERGRALLVQSNLQHHHTTVSGLMFVEEVTVQGSVLSRNVDKAGLSIHRSRRDAI
uniref:Cytochrome c oxidase subunit Vb n=1 Tax=Timema cristinae TaxID=61476 RepID=A0A7R9D1I2_TIMCR|nr:unnamed protein product [Timema cristinae]